MATMREGKDDNACRLLFFFLKNQPPPSFQKSNSLSSWDY